jgi:hypothetical protein
METSSRTSAIGTRHKVAQRFSGKIDRLSHGGRRCDSRAS